MKKHGCPIGRFDDALFRARGTNAGGTHGIMESHGEPPATTKKFLRLLFLLGLRLVEAERMAHGLGDRLRRAADVGNDLLDLLARDRLDLDMDLLRIGEES